MSSAFSPHSVFTFLMIVTTNGDYFAEEYAIGVFIADPLCAL
jgi:hypothetical protein